MRSRPRRLFSVIALGAACLLLAPIEDQADAATAAWEFIDSEQGITVTKRDEEDRQLPTFKGIGKVQASIYDVLAVILDADRHVEWMHDCAASAKVKQVSETEMIVYNRTDAPWPVKDRDVVLKGTLDVVKPGQRVVSRFRVASNSHRAKVPDVIRMPWLKGHWKLTQLRNGTQVEYKVNADPAGRLPDWLVERTARYIPLYTIVGLRDQVNATRGTYDDAIAGYKERGY